MNLYQLTATELIEKIKKEEISIRELVDSFVTRIESLENVIHAWAYFNKDIVYKQIEELLELNLDGRFYGIPIGVKDIFNTRDMPTAMGSAIWKGFTPGNDARVIHDIKMEGGIVMGKTVTAEFAVHFPGPTLNPHNFDYFPGTSSTGSAAAVATGMVPLALGTQTAGSIIKPASYCGVYGYKPSFGLSPRTGVLKTVDPLDHVGFLARCIDDIKLMLDVIRVKGPNYPYIHRYLENKDRQEKKADMAWRVGFVKTHVWADAEDYTKESIINFIDNISNIEEIEVKEVHLPIEFEEAHFIHEIIYNKALSYYFKEEYEKYPHLVSDIFKKMVEEGKKITLDSYINALKNQANLTLLLDTFFEIEDLDVIFAISTAGEPPKKEFYMNEKRDTSLIWTLCRAASMSLPVFKGPRGLPFGIQVVSRRYNDYRLLSFLKFLEEKHILQKKEVVLI